MNEQIHDKWIIGHRYEPAEEHHRTRASQNYFKHKHIKHINITSLHTQTVTSPPPQHTHNIITHMNMHIHITYRRNTHT